MEDNSDLDDDDEDLDLLAKKLRKFMRKCRSSSYRRNNNKQRRDSSKDLCYNCKKHGHYITDCNKPLREELIKDKNKKYAKKDKKTYKKFQKKDKGLVAEGSWSQSENDSYSDSSNDEGPYVVNLCLMAMETPVN